MAEIKVYGTCSDRFIKVKQKLQENLSTGRDLGASICININGQTVVDIWGGFADSKRTKPWGENTIATLWSTTKNVASLATLILIDRGILDPEEKVCTYWPEFGVKGKENVQVKHFLSHTSGLSGWVEPVTVDDVFDVVKATRLLEQQAPLWLPGTQSGYHALTMGFLLGGLIHRVTGKTIGQFIADEITTPLKADFQLGVKQQDIPRVAEMILPPPPPPTPDNTPLPAAFSDPTSVMFRTFMNPPLDPSVANNNPTWRTAELAAANGHSNAKAITRILSTISLGGTVNGIKLLSPETIDKIFVEQSNGQDLALGKAVRFGLGYGIASPTQDRDTLPNWIPAGKIASWGGLGGSLAVMDRDRGLTFGYVMNKMEHVAFPGDLDENGVQKTDRQREYIALTYEALDVGGIVLVGTGGLA
ncbi:beta-lactamase [Pyrenophora seminiperda CCB06]|uniref:Beta-lactamase n=1 Tax=Pyrenophora seminiperda CCB06 TaxID=1302712 RepID=A0A3M7MGM4_9PLEO|nr:beta-lactamase [Pyrenophora seminiperda CCB06]